MYHLGNICWFCLGNTSVLYNLHDTRTNNKLTYYEKLKPIFLDVVFESNYVKICPDCCTNIDNMYEFRRKSVACIAACNEYINELHCVGNKKDVPSLGSNDIGKKSNLEPVRMEYNLPCPENEVQSDNLNCDSDIVQHENKDCEKLKIVTDNTCKSVGKSSVEPIMSMNIKTECPSDSDSNCGEQASTEDMGENFDADNQGCDTNVKSETETQNDSSMTNITNPGISDNKKYEQSSFSVLKMEEFDIKDEETNNFDISGFSKHFLDEDNQESHQNQTDNKRNAYQCPNCQKTFIRVDDFEKHKIFHIREKPYECQKCQMAFSTIDSLRKHINLHNATKRYNCKECKMVFTKLGNLNKHMKLHTAEQEFEDCPESNVDEQGENCPETTTFEQPKSVHTKEKKHKCTKCEKSFLWRGSCKVHLKVAHGGEKPHECQHCDKKFRLACELKVHERLHTGEKPYSCEECSKTFRMAASYKSHMMMHSGQKPFQCTKCEKAFPSVARLNKHLRFTHSSDKPFKCTECGKSFGTAGHLKLHEKIHSGERECKCTLCDKAFTYSGDLQKHMRIHSGERPYVCVECNKAFTQAVHLKGHMRCHTGERPYKCNVCEKTFAWSSTLRKHKKTCKE